MKKLFTILLIVMVAASVFANGKAETAAATTGGYKDTITVGIGADVTSFDPHIGKETPAVAVTNHIFDTLVDVNQKTGEVVPQIAESWEILSDVQYRFHIRKGIKFHNGEDLTASDVKFSLDRAINSAAVSYVVNFIKDVKIEDEYTVLVTLKAPYAPALRNLAVPFAAIVPEDYVKANPDALKTAPVGSGPYKFVSWDQSNNSKLEAYDGYYAGAPLTKNLVFKVIPEAAQRTIALETGELDIAYDLSTNDLKRVADNKKLALYEAPSLTCWYLSFNMKNTPFNNKLVRQALNYAIDRQLLVDTVFSKAGEPADAIIAPAVFGYVSPGTIEYNPEKAKKLLAEAGYPNGFKCNIWVNDNQQRIEACQAIQAMYKEIGVEATLDVQEFGTFINNTTNAKHDIAFFGWVTSTKDADYTYYSLEHSSQQGAAGNRSFVNDPKVDELVDIARTNADDATRLKAYGELAAYLKDLANNAPILYSSICAGANAKVEGFNLDPIGYHQLQTVKIAK